MIFSLLFLMFSMVTAAQSWHTNLEDAKQVAQSKSRPILLIFQGSDWCIPCMKLDHEVWSTDEFKTYAAQHLVLLRADFPRKKKNVLTPALAASNALLADQYNEQGIFPLVVKLDMHGHVQGMTGYKKMSATNYIAHLESL